MKPPTLCQRLGLDDEYNQQLLEDWKTNNQGEPPPVGGLRFFPLRFKTQEKPSGKSNDHS